LELELEPGMEETESMYFLRLRPVTKSRMSTETVDDEKGRQGVEWYTLWLCIWERGGGIVRVELPPIARGAIK